MYQPCRSPVVASLIPSPRLSSQRSETSPLIRPFRRFYKNSMNSPGEIPGKRRDGVARNRCLLSSPLLPPGEGRNGRGRWAYPFYSPADTHRTAALACTATISIFAAVFDHSSNGHASFEQAPNRSRREYFHGSSWPVPKACSFHRALSNTFP